MRHMKAKALKRIIPFYPAIPIVPVALLFATLATSLSAFFRVRRLERRLATAGV
jgi:uncharacterized membrane protein